MPPVTPFSSILRRAVEQVPGAMGAIFADWEGEAVDCVTKGPADELLILAAHYGVILNHVQSALHLTHFGEAEEVILQHQKVDLIVRAVDKDYYIVLVAGPDSHLATALREVALAATALRKEMA